MPLKKRSRTNTRVACDSCRAARVKCEISQPSCARCLERALHCVYETSHNEASRRETFRQRDRVHRKLIDDLRASLTSLRALSDDSALQILHTITQSDDPLAMLASLPSINSLPPTPPGHAINGAAVPAGVLPFQYELMMRFPHAYPAVSPLIHTSGDLSALERSDQRLVTAHRSEPDSRLADAPVSYWTNVQTDEIEARELLKHYLETDHPILGLFDADLFLTDLSSCSHAFCSHFLVNCILLWSSISCSSESQVARSCRSEFFQAADNLWREVRHVDDVTTAAAAQLFSLACACEGEDAIAQDLKMAGCAMADRLGLFNTRTSVASVTDRGFSASSRRWRAHVAWGVYKWQSLHALHYRRPPIGSPPSLPIPGNESGDIDEALTDPSSPYMTSTITSLCKFWRILHPIVERWTSESDRHLLSQEAMLGTAEEVLRQLLSWSDDELQKCSESGTLNQPHHILVMHIWLHTAVMEILRPFYRKGWAFKTFDTRQSTPEVIFWSSLTRLECLALEYRQNIPSASSSIFWHLSLLFIGNAVVHRPIRLSWRFRFLLCTYSYADLAGSFPVAGGFLRAILHMALQRNLISLSQARDIISRMPNESVPGATRLNDKRSSLRWSHVADLELALTDHPESQVTDLAERFNDAMIFDDFVDEYNDAA